MADMSVNDQTVALSVLTDTFSIVTNKTHQLQYNKHNKLINSLTYKT